MKWENKLMLTKKINWGMLISHHPPSQHDRTYSFLGIRFCTRCTGIIIGVISSIILIGEISKDSRIITIISVIILPLPAIINFTLNELGKIRNNNFKRILTGFLLGLIIGLALDYLISAKYLYGFLILLWIFILEIIVTIILHKADVLEHFMQQYEEGVYKD